MKNQNTNKEWICLTWQFAVICYVPVPEFRVGLVPSIFAATIEV